MKAIWNYIAQNGLLQHGLFWALSYWFLLDFFALSERFEYTDYIYTFLFHISLVFMVYSTIRLLFPMLFEKGHYLSFLIAGFVLICFSSYLNHLTFSYLSNWIFADYYFISYYEFGDLMQFMLAYFAISSLLKLSKSWFYLREKEQAFERLQKEKVNAELLALKSQLNPHFLFNSLNNIYALSLDKDKVVPDLILRLSQTMRYMLYECNGERVALSREIGFLEDYVALQKCRTDHKADIRFDIKGERAGRFIAPLLMIPFIENGFKHGIKGGYEEAFIQIIIVIKEEWIQLSVENNLGQQDETLERQVGGIGLENVRKRLALIYPSRHRLNIEKSDKQFKIQLDIKDD